ncbi:MAG: zf-HC2 domain-containing protein [Planctomycetota bacterium]|nr:zf-HC2 domain-containing protein [Planctomycetota bacterium]
MNCNHCQRLISRALDARLSSVEEQDLQSHLETCETCEREWREQSRMRQLIQSLPEVETEAVLLDVMERLRSSDAKAREAKLILFEEVERFARWFVPLAAMLMVVLSGFVLRGMHSRSQNITDGELAQAYLEAEFDYDSETEADVWGLSSLVTESEASP